MHRIIRRHHHYVSVPFIILTAFFLSTATYIQLLFVEQKVVAATCEGVTITPDDDFDAIVQANSEGTTFCITKGVHYEAQTIPKEGQKFIGEYGAVLSGARPLHAEDALLDGNGRWYWTGQSQQGQVHGNIESGGNPMDAYPEEFFVNDVTRLERVDSLANLDAPGEWYFDYDADRIYTYDDPTTFYRIETSVVDFAIAPLWWTFGEPGAHDGDATPEERTQAASEYPDSVIIENLVVEKYANPAQMGAIGHQAYTINASDNWEIRNVESRYNHGCGIRVPNGSLLENSSIHHNGQIGLCGSGESEEGSKPMTIRNNRIYENRVLDFNWSWEGGATKFSFTEGMLFENNWVHDNYGPGIWHDINNYDTTIRSNLVENNDFQGIFYEISYGNVDIHWNTVKNNGMLDESWAGDSGAGIELSSSDGDDGSNQECDTSTGTPCIEVYENLIDGNRWGIFSHGNDGRSDGSGNPIELDNIYIHHNEIRAGRSDKWMHNLRITDQNDAVIDNNTYYLTDETNKWYSNFNGAGYNAHDFSGWQALGYDINSEIRDYNLRPQFTTNPAAVEFGYAGYGSQPDGTTPLVCSGVQANSGDNLQALVDANPEGTTFCLSAGTYREQRVLPKARMTFIGEAGAVLKGSKVLDAEDFSTSGPPYSIGGQTQQTITRSSYATGYGCDSWTEGSHIAECGNEQEVFYDEELFADGNRLRHVNSLGEMDAPGEWYFDYDSDTIYMYDNPSSFDIVETSTTKEAFYGTAGADYVTIANLEVAQYANWAQRGAIGARASNHNVVPAKGWSIHNVNVNNNHGGGIDVGPDWTVTNSIINRNGQIGVAGEMHNQAVTITGNEIAYNMELGFQCGWEGGATKFKETNALFFENNWVHDNACKGFWADIDNIHGIVRSNLIENNEETDLFWEISYNAKIYWNQVFNTSTTSDPGQVTNRAVGIIDSQDVEVFGNHIIGSDVPLIAWQQDRGNAMDLTNLYVHHNDVEITSDWVGHQVGLQYQDGVDPYVYTANNLFDHNRYYNQSGAQNAWWYNNGADRTFAEWQAASQDVNGQVAADNTDFGLPAGAVAYSATERGPIDITDPSVSVATPADGTIVSSTTEIEATATDNIAVDRVVFYVNGSAVETDTTNPYSFSFNPATYADGDYTVTANAYDNEDNNTSDSITITVTVPPAVSITSPADGATVTNTAAVTATATDNDAIDRVEFAIDGTPLSTDTTTPYSIDLDTTAHTNQTYVVTATAFDMNENSSVDSISITINNAQQKVGDLNNDSNVDIFDMSILLSNYNTAGPTGDLNSNGIVDIFDMSILLSNYGS